MKPILIVLLLLVLASSSILNAADAKKPNIIFILADDLGIGDVGCYKADHFKTPNIDALAQSGMRFEHCYASPLCGPTRALVMTGRYAFRTGMTSNKTGHFLEPGKEIMMPAMIKPAGYVTAQCGKWAQLPLQPSDWGFDEYLRFEGSGKYWSYQKEGKTYTLNGKPVVLNQGEYLPDRMHEFVVDFITRHKNQPFYLYYALSLVHGPTLPTPDSAPGTTDQFQLYQDNVAYMDKLVGKLMAELDHLKLRDNTIVVFVGDNGTAAPFWPRCTIDGGKNLSGHKATMQECGALVPCMISWPGHVPANTVTQGLINICDFYPTLGKIAGASMPAGVLIDGQDFSPQMIGASQNWPRDWIFVMLGIQWYDRDMFWKMDQDHNLFDMHNAPFTELLVPATAVDPAAATARTKLQTVLNQLDPAKALQAFHGDMSFTKAKPQKPEKPPKPGAGGNPDNQNEPNE